ncbi:phytoene/squalene synthase family protein [Demequina sp.]|uniref:phytoene/squalene synthase family protein n=1 Tax=Demequina sp. TaxID=2050685 RepID=UPI003D0DD7CC
MTTDHVKGTGHALDAFTRTAQGAANTVIDSYSTSFGMATRLLGARHRQHVRNIYALVRVADEIVDGVAAQAGLSVAEQREVLARFRADTDEAVARGYSADVVIHAFACTARASGIGPDLTDPFFDSMAMDLEPGDAPHDAYVWGSAEVVGLMCLRVFLRDESPSVEQLRVMEHGARQLGAAFQDINFLRDLADDLDLGRHYLGERLTDADKDAWVARIRGQLADASLAIPLLPRDARAAVRTAQALFARLTDRVAATPASELYARRVRVADPVKAYLGVRALAATALERR